MAYTPINWQTGDTITAEKMNKMDNGWGMQSTQLFSESVTTEDSGSGMNSGALVYSTLINSASIAVTFNGTDYTCPRIDAFDEYFYGGFSQSGPDFSVFPFALESTPGVGNTIYTQTAGTYTVAVSAEGLVIADNFAGAVGKSIVIPTFTENIDTGNFECDMSFSDVLAAINDGRCFYAYVNSEHFFLNEAGTHGISFSKIMVTSYQIDSRTLYFSTDSIYIATVTYPGQ